MINRLFHKLKKLLYFPLASYFKFFSSIRLNNWKPRIVVITGSSGKTTLLHLLELQIGDSAVYSHFANSAYGIPFNILGLRRKSLTFWEWPKLFLLAPLQIFNNPPSQKLYIVEADCDRVGEGKFLANLLNPEVTVWLSSNKTHSANFPQPVEESIAHEFGYFLKNTTKKVIINGDSKLIKDESSRTNADVEVITEKNLEKYQLEEDSTKFVIGGVAFKFRFPLPEETFYQIAAMLKVLSYLEIRLDDSFSKFNLPPGRSSIFRGIKNTTILDSSYNADLESMRVMLKMFDQYPEKTKWIVLGDLVEQGKLEEQEHTGLVPIISRMKLDKIILVGPRLAKYVHPKFKSESFIQPKDALNYIMENTSGGEVIFFKGARFLEGIIEHLLENREDITKLCRREKIWQDRRRRWGL